MSLDFNVRDDHNLVIRSMGLGVDEHWEIVQLAAKRGYVLLGRLRDYYADAEFFVEELPAFLVEVEALRSQGELSPKARSDLTDLADVIRFALAERRSLEVLAD